MTQTEYFLGDALGSVRHLVDASGQVILARSYEPYGDVLTSAGSGTTSYDFTGEWRDGSGLIYLRARYYASGVGRFATRDTWRGSPNSPYSLNGWQYVRNNPVNFTDPSGHCILGTNCFIAADMVIMAGAGSYLYRCDSLSLTPVYGSGTASGLNHVTYALLSRNSVATLNGNAVFIDSDPLKPNAKAWKTSEIAGVERMLAVAVTKMEGSSGFGNRKRLYTELGVSTSSPIKLVRETIACDYTNSPPTCVYLSTNRPFITTFDIAFPINSADFSANLTHELAHYWDQNHGFDLSDGMNKWVTWGVAATDYGESRPKPGSTGYYGEDFAEAVKIYFWPALDDAKRAWSDDIGNGLSLAGGKADGLTIQTDPHEHANIVQDRYDWVQLQFTGKWK